VRSAGDIRAGRAFIQLFIDDSNVVKQMRRTQYKFETMGRVWQRAGLWMMGGGAAILGSLGMAAKKFADMGLEMQAMSKAAGMGVEPFSELMYAAKMSGVEVDSLQMAIRGMQFKIHDLGDNVTEVVQSFRELGLTYADLKDLSPEEQFKLIADRLQRVTDRSALAQAVFRRGGTRILAMGGAEEIGGRMAQAREKGLYTTEAEIAQAVRLKRGMVEVQESFRMLAFTVGARLAPVMQLLTRRLADFVEEQIRATREGRGSVGSLLSLGTAAIGAGVAVTGMALSWRLIAFALGAATAPINLVVLAVIALGGAIAATNIKWNLETAAINAETKAVNELIDRYLELKAKREGLTVSERAEKVDIGQRFVRQVESEIAALQAEWGQLNKEISSPEALVAAGVAGLPLGGDKDIRARMDHILAEIEKRDKILEKLDAEQAKHKGELELEEEEALAAELTALERGTAERVAELRAEAIREEMERETALINLRYDREVEKAREAALKIRGEKEREVALTAALANVEEARELELEAARTARMKKAADAAKDYRLEQEDAARDRKARELAIQDEIERLRIEKTTAGLEQARALIDLELREALRGVMPGTRLDELIRQLYGMRKEGALGGAEGAVVTFQSRALWGLGAGGIFDRIARATEETARNTGRQSRGLGADQPREAWA